MATTTATTLHQQWQPLQPQPLPHLRRLTLQHEPLQADGERAATLVQEVTIEARHQLANGIHENRTCPHVRKTRREWRRGWCSWGTSTSMCKRQTLRESMDAPVSRAVCCRTAFRKVCGRNSSDKRTGSDKRDGLSACARRPGSAVNAPHKVLPWTWSRPPILPPPLPPLALALPPSRPWRPTASTRHAC